MIPVVILIALVAGAEPGAKPVRPFEIQSDLTPRGHVDELVFSRLRRLGIEPACLCSDEVFLRRAYLDVIGTLPTVEEARQFLADGRANRRSVLIDRLLARDEFADYWAMKWSELLRVKAEFPINLWPNAAQAYHRWIRTSLRTNLPYDRFVREMLTASGSNFRVPQVNFYRAMQSRDPQTIAQTVALTFMGTRAERWPKERLTAMSAFFSQVGSKETAEWKEEILFFDPAKSGPVSVTTFPDGSPASLAPDQDPREVFADWLTSPRNPCFARAIVNRLWSWLLGRGIVHEADDFRPDNLPSNPELLAYLETELAAAHYDLKHVFRLILNSKTYQLSAIPRSKSPQALAEFASYPVHRLEAEVLIDALNQVTGTAERYSSPIPEPFTFIPEGQRSIALADGSINSPFLELFGRPPRDTGLESERNNRPLAAQKLHMLNSSHIRRKIEQGPNLRSLFQGGANPREGIGKLYLTILSRYPTEAELQVLAAYNRSGKAKRNEVVFDIAWALINSAEFQFRH